MEVEGAEEKGPDGTFVDWLDLLTLCGLSWLCVVLLVLPGGLRPKVCGLYGRLVHSTQCHLLTLQHSVPLEDIFGFLTWPVTQGHFSPGILPIGSWEQLGPYGP